MCVSDLRIVECPSHSHHPRRTYESGFACCIPSGCSPGAYFPFEYPGSLIPSVGLRRKMSAYPMHPTAAAAPSPHTGFVQPGATAPTPGANMYSTNSTPFSNPYSATSRQAAYSHHQQHGSGSAVQPHYQQFSGCTSQPTPPASASMTATGGSQQKHPAGGSFQVAQVGLTEAMLFIVDSSGVSLCSVVHGI